MDFKNIGEARRWASLFLKEHQRDENIGVLLLMHHLNMELSRLLASMHESFPNENVKELWISDVRAHAEKGIPVQHIIGFETFYGRKFKVNEHVLIPRPETEELVQLVLKEVVSGFGTVDFPLHVVDIGAGSGAISITLNKENPSLKVLAVDISPDALQVARENAKNLGAEVDFLEGDFLEPIILTGQKMDVIVSNPPYISIDDKEDLSDVVRVYDPELALFAGKDGLDAYRRIVSQLPQVIKERALVAFEIGYQQGKAVKEILLSTFPQSNPQIVQDINKKDRIVYCWL